MLYIKKAYAFVSRLWSLANNCILYTTTNRCGFRLFRYALRCALKSSSHNSSSRRRPADSGRTGLWVRLLCALLQSLLIMHDFTSFAHLTNPVLGFLPSTPGVQLRCMTILVFCNVPFLFLHQDLYVVIFFLDFQPRGGKLNRSEYYPCTCGSVCLCLALLVLQVMAGESWSVMFVSALYKPVVAGNCFINKTTWLGKKKIKLITYELRRGE